MCSPAPTRPSSRPAGSPPGTPGRYTGVKAELDLLYEIFGGNFVERWPEWNGFEDALLGRKLEVLTAR